MPDGVRYLIGEQNRIKALLSQVPHRGPQGGEEELGLHIGALVTIYVTITEELVWPLLAESDSGEFQRNHDEVHQILAAVNESSPGSPGMFAALQNLSAAVLRLFDEEGAQVFPKLEGLGAQRMEDLGHQIYARAQELLKDHPDYTSPAAAIVHPVL